ncbi:hypothetical protein B0J15DRAFT_577149 [Fusarium solani]|jgi:hypothetical protein|uniref:Uncharacterized protein n=1 Tax=Fusarium solani TaxID=169388 RepID=A0A9P9JMB4_FUSSL|nr:uncharacterized protein B0J15DRAFT_577149 [Fusarium solani]KAH7230247.1 hypothetical protein B0J15DRAFT_577149 [Fusarium solani]
MTIALTISGRITRRVRGSISLASRRNAAMIPSPTDRHRRQPSTGGQTFSKTPPPRAETSDESPRPKPDINRQDKGDRGHDEQNLLQKGVINGLLWALATVYCFSSRVLERVLCSLFRNRLVKYFCGMVIGVLVLMLLWYYMMPSTFSFLSSAIWTAISSISGWIGVKQPHAYTKFPKLKFQQVISTAEPDNLPSVMMTCHKEVQIMRSEKAYELAEDFEKAEKNTKLYQKLNDKFIQEIETHSNTQF